MKDKPIVLILCGGKSLRLWPLSQYKSKNFLDIFGFSPLELTIKRFLKVTWARNIFLVANKKEKRTFKNLKLIKKSNVIFEPQSKNTAAAILLSLTHLKKNPNKKIIISPVDQLIKNENQFYSALDKSLKAASRGYICTLGIKPTQATSSFGYIQTSKSGNNGVFDVKRFIEKPTAQKAKKLIAQGNCSYNSGMFISEIAILLEEYSKYYPRYDEVVSSFNKKKIDDIYKKIPNIPFDKAIMEKTKKIKLVKGDFFWRDFGSWDAIHEILTKDKSNNAKKGNVSILNGKNNLIYLADSKKKVLALGLNDIFFVDTKDYSLLINRAYLSKLKASLKSLEKFK